MILQEQHVQGKADLGQSRLVRLTFGLSTSWCKKGVFWSCGSHV